MTTTRRGFLASSAVLAAALTPGLEAVSAPAQEKPRWRTGVGLNGFMSSADLYKKSYPIWEILDFTANEGFDGVELVDNWPMGGYPSPDESGRIAALKRMYAQYGLQTYTFQTFGSGCYSADANARRDWVSRFREYVRLGQALGCEFIGHWPGGDLQGNANVDNAITNLVSSYKEAAQICADAGMYMSFEIEPPFIFNTMDHLQRILAGVNHPACKTNYDPSHFDLMWGSKGKPEEMLKQLGVQHIGHVHLTDTDGTIFNGTSKHLACGEGHCDIPASLKMLWDGGYSGWLMIDAWMIEDAYNAYHKGKVAIDAVRKPS